MTFTVDDWFSAYAKYTDITEWEASEWNGLVEHVHDTLLKNNTLNTTGWTLFHHDLATKGTDDDVFQGVGIIAEAVCQAALLLKPRLQRTTVVQRYSPSPQPPGFSQMLVFPERPTRSSDKLTPTQNVMTAEFKLHNELRSSQENEVKIVDGASHLLYKDPRRRFVYGLAIEGENMRLWHFNRSHIATSETFDYHKNPRHFIRFLLFLIFAPMSALGFDPTVERTFDETDEIAYVYQVGDSWYQTIGSPLSEKMCSDVVSRATRVWVVRRVLAVDSDGTRQLDTNVNVLKDVWLFEDALGDKAIQDAIFANLQKLNEAKSMSGMAEEAKKYFMTILEDEKVQVYGKDDITPRCALRMDHTTEGSQQDSDDSDSVTHLETTTDASSVHHRIHWRTVYRERCETVYEVLDFQDLTECIQHNIKGLWYMRLAGFVHGDISAGNCMWHKASGQGKISNLEYARLYDQLSPHNGRTGTPQFMSVESQVQAFKLMGKHWIKLPFTYNFYHDVESLLWIFIWFLFNRIPLTNMEPPLPILESLRAKLPLDLVRNVHAVADETQLTYEGLEEIRTLGRKLFACDSHGTITRDTFIFLGEHKLLEYTLMPVYAKFSHFLDPIKIVLDVKAALERLEASKPTMSSQGVLRWDAELFTEELYLQFHSKLQEVIVGIKASGKSMVTFAPDLQPAKPSKHTAKRRHATAHPLVDVTATVRENLVSRRPSYSNKKAKKHD